MAGGRVAHVTLNERGVVRKICIGLALGLAARLERNTAKKCLDEEGKNAMNLRSKVLEMEKRVEETVKERAMMKREHGILVSQKKEMESQVASLEKKKDLLRKTSHVA
ncbi:hypothetical protein OIU78_029512 [Salix suchowensis]|nr:hypothetical protein OIU78_029512 [Salix suchowensis]